MNWVSPNPSPVSIDVDESTLDTSTLPTPSTPKKNRLIKKVRKRKPSPSHSHKHDDVLKDRSHTVPGGEWFPSLFNDLRLCSENRESHQPPNTHHIKRCIPRVWQTAKVECNIPIFGSFSSETNLLHKRFLLSLFFYGFACGTRF